MRIWCLTTSPDNFAATAAHGWTVQGIKSRRRRTADELEPGDKLIYYVTRYVAFGGIVDVTSRCFEDHEPIWSSKPGEDYPWRVEISPDLVMTDPDKWVPVETIREELEYLSRWPAEHWRLGFQGNIREWPEQDHDTVRRALQS